MELPSTLVRFGGLQRLIVVVDSIAITFCGGVGVASQEVRFCLVAAEFKAPAVCTDGLRMLTAAERTIAPAQVRCGRRWRNVPGVRALQSAESEQVAVDGSLRDVKLFQFLAQRLFVSRINDHCMDVPPVYRRSSYDKDASLAEDPQGGVALHRGLQKQVAGTRRVLITGQDVPDVTFFEFRGYV